MNSSKWRRRRQSPFSEVTGIRGARKRHIAVDATGLLLTVLITAAGIRGTVTRPALRASAYVDATWSVSIC